MWINPETQQTYANHSEIRAAYQHVSLPAELSDEFIASMGFMAIEPPAPPPPTIADFDAALTRHLDATAQARRWEDRITLAVRAGYPNPWQVEAIAFGTWMDDCNAIAYGFMAEVQDGTRPLPKTTQVLIEALPLMVWPE